MSGNISELMLSEPGMSNEDLLVRETFVQEYMKDHNAFTAALRTGFNAEFAAEYAKQFMAEPYFYKRKWELEIAFNITQETEDSLSKQEEDEPCYDATQPIDTSTLTPEELDALIVSRLLTESSVGNAGSRVAALNTLVKIRGLDIKKPEETKDNTSGVMIVQEIPSVESFEAEAIKHQSELKEQMKEL